MRRAGFSETDLPTFSLDQWLLYSAARPLLLMRDH
ncbi:hypothetical protein RHECNPAF_890065 [Rhizobium etli CNPAF512]|nr:hypothetical protein RHECNPAF_890065 [Rhizobium etli CNPAF512]